MNAPERVVVVVPCYNEADRLDVEAFVRGVEALPGLGLLFVDDGSTDATGEVLQRLTDRLGGRADVLTLSANRGKAEAVRTGLMAAVDAKNGEAVGAVGYLDADLATPLSEVGRFRKALFEREETVAVIGSRVLLMGRHIERRPLRHYSGRVFATLAALTLGFPVYDTQCGAKLFRVIPAFRAVISRPFISRWAFDVELLARLRNIYGPDLGARGLVVEHPLERWTDVGASKVKLSDLPRMVVDLIRIRRQYR